jgi:hypothetical protein
MPQSIALLTMIRFAEDSVAEIQKRHCPPAETYVFGLSLQMWPIFQKGMTEHVESIKKLAEGTSAGYFSRAATTTDAMVENVSILHNALARERANFDGHRFALNTSTSSTPLCFSQKAKLTI